MTSSAAAIQGSKSTKSLESAVIRFCGDSGDGMQLTGSQFTTTSAIFGNDVVTFPDFPAEIRAPAGTLPGVSGFQVNFAATDIYTPGDAVDVLVAMNPAGLKTNVGDVKRGGIVIANSDAFNSNNLKKAGYETNPLEDGSLDDFRLFSVPISRLCEESLAESDMGAKAIGRAKNMYTLGMVYWLFDRSLEPTINHLTNLFAKKKNQPEIADLNIKALKAGYYYGETAEIFQNRFEVAKAKLPPGRYRQVSGNEALALGLVAASNLAKRKLVFSGYPITPASDILHSLSNYKHYNTRTLQLEDEIAAMAATVGAAFAGQIAVTATSGPGLALKAEALGLGIMIELPMVVINVQRGGPSTGLPTKTEQADLLQAIHGRNGECPCIVIAASGPADCFNTAIEAVRLSTQYMTPVILLSDGYIANGAEPWLIPDVPGYEPIDIKFATEFNAHSNEADGDGNNIYYPYIRNDKLARPWAAPGTPKLEHRVGGLEKNAITGNVSYDPANHQKMVDIRQAKVDGVAKSYPPTRIQGSEEGDVLIIGWGGTYGSIHAATERLLEHGHKVGAIHLRYVNPLPLDLGDIMSRYKTVVVPELNTGQLRQLLRAKYLVDAKGINKVQGKPFLVSELVATIEEMIAQAK